MLKYLFSSSKGSPYPKKRKLNDELTVYGYIHASYDKHECSLFPNDLIDLCFLYYHVEYEVLKWSLKYKRMELQLFHNNECIGPQSEKLRAYKWALCDIEPMKYGRHCFRFEIINRFNYWFSTCIARPQKYPDTATSRHGVYGCGSDPNWYPYSKLGTLRDSNKNHKGTWKSPTGLTHYHIDMLFDADIGELNFCVLEQKDILNAKIWNIPINTDYGFVPHFNTICTDQLSVKIARIPVESYGQPIADIFAEPD